MKTVYLKTGQRDSNTVIATGDMRCYYINIIASSTKIQQANQCHGSWVMCRALTPDIHYCFISQWNNIFCLAHWWPHVLTELTMANSSFHKIDWTTVLGPVTSWLEATAKTKRHPIPLILRHQCRDSFLSWVSNGYQGSGRILTNLVESLATRLDQVELPELYVCDGEDISLSYSSL